MIRRSTSLAALRTLFRTFPVAGVLGARQVGKTTLARQFAARRSTVATYFDLENPRDLARLQNPLLELEPLRGLVVLDEIQRRPDLFPVLRGLADRVRVRTRFLVLGSAAPELLRQSSETLAGRIGYVELGGFGLEDVGAAALETLWLRGGFPRAFLAPADDSSALWRAEFIRTFVERDLAALGVGIPPASIGRFWSMLAHYHGQVLNSTELARALAVSDKTIRSYLDALCATFMARRLRPWAENLAKREVKAPKVYVADSGLLHQLLGIRTREDLAGHPKVGASWEGFAIQEVTRRLGARPDECYFWALHSGAELDLLVVRGKLRLGFEIKRTETPSVTPSMRSALENLRLDRLDVVHAGPDTFQLDFRIRALSLTRVLTDLKPLARR